MSQQVKRTQGDAEAAKAHPAAEPPAQGGPGGSAPAPSVTGWTAYADAIMKRFSTELGEAGGLEQKRVSALLDELVPLIGTAGKAGAEIGNAASVDARDIGKAVAALRATILDEVTRRAGRPLSAEETASLHRAIDEAAAERYADWANRRLSLYRVESEGHSRYMSFLSHDLRGNLNGLVLMLEVMRREIIAAGEGDQKVQDLDLLRRSLLDTVALIERHVLADRVRRGRVVPSPGDVKLAELVQKVAARFASEAAARQVTVEVDASQAGIVRSDEELLDPILSELLSNAIRHSRSPRILVIAESNDRGWSVSVVDEGTDDRAERISTFLDPVQRMELKDRGLGLTLAHDLGRLLGGRVTATREQNRTVVRLAVAAPAEPSPPALAPST